WPYPEHIDVPDMLRDLAAEHPTVQFRLSQILASDPNVPDLLAARLDAAWQSPDVANATPRDMAALTEQTPITTASFREGAAPNLPAQAQHLLLCAGRRCSELGSAGVYRQIAALLGERGLDEGPQRIRLTRTKCLGPCATAPVACLY